MNTRNRRKIETGLKNKGFEVDDSGRDHKFFTYYDLTGKKTSVFTKTSRGRQYRELGDDLIGDMAKQCKVNKQEFMKLVDCDLKREEYDSIIQDYLRGTYPPRL